MSLTGKLLRAALVAYYRPQLGSVGRRWRLGIGSTIETPHDVFVGDDVFMGPRTYIASPTRVEIQDRVMFGPEVMLIGGDHDLHNTSVSLRFAPAPPNPPPIVIEHDSWICSRVLILKGVRIGAHSVIGAGSVVTKDIPPNSIAVGNPCRVLRVRGDLFCPKCGAISPQA